MNINLQIDCESRPKKARLKDLTTFFAAYQLEQVAKYLAEDITWILVGDTPIQGRVQFIAALAKMSDNKAQELRIDNILVDGDEATVHGLIRMEDDSRFGFADFYKFTNTDFEQVRTIRSYVIPLSDNN